MDSGLGFVQPMFFVGVVEDRNDPRAEGRVRVRAFGVHGSNQDIATEELPWATLIIGNHDVNFTPPPLNAWVFGFFIDGRDAQQPMILGLIPSQASELVDPATRGWGSVPAENYDRESQGARPRDLGLSPMSRLATGEFLNETYNEALETNRVRNIPVAGGCAAGHNAVGNGNAWSNDIGETADTGQVSTRVSSATEQEIYQGLRARGLSDAAAKGIIANMIAESNLNPGINEIAPLVPGSRGGFGLIQWTGPRRRALEAEAQRRGVSVNNLDFQLDYLIIELEGPERRSYNNILRTDDPVEAARIFSDQNLRPGIPNMPKRLSEARRLADIEFDITQPQGPQLFNDPSQPDRIQQAQLDEQRFSRADEIRTRIAAIDARLEELGSRPQTEEARNQLIAERAQLESELAGLEGSGATEGTSGEPYSGYANPSNAPGCVSSWEEPPSGYGARYPYNRVIETASGHSIELDDTPGGERIMIWHRDGSYVQITGSSTTHKNMSDAYHVNERNNHVYIGGNNIVTIEGDSYVLVKGDKVEEIEGNYKQIVHGNVQIGGGGRVEINGADSTDIRSASLSLDSNVENLNIRTGKNIVFESGESFNVKSKNVRLGASENMSVTGQKGLFLQSQGGDVHVKSDGNVFLNPDQNLFLRTEGGTISAEAKGSIRFNSSGSFISINSSSYMSLGSKGEMLIGAEGGSLNLNSSENLGISGKNTFIKGSENVNIKAEGGMTNIGAEGDITLDTNGDFFVGASGDANAKAQNVNIEGLSEIDIKAGGAGYIESGAVLNLLAGSDARLSGSNAHIRGSTVFIDDIVQLANGAASSASAASGAADGNDVEVKEPIDPSRFGDGSGEFGGEIAAQAQAAEVPASTQSAAAGPAEPPVPMAPNPAKTKPNETDDNFIGPMAAETVIIPPGGTVDATNPRDVGRTATESRALNLDKTNLIGVMGKNDRAIVRLPSGQIITDLRVGSELNGGRVTAISADSLTYSVGGRTVILRGLQ